MAPPRRIVDWINMAYPKPQVDEEWLDACCTWIRDEYSLEPDVQTEEFIAHVETQLLRSGLCDSMVEGTGLPAEAWTLKNKRISGTPILVEITAITEIGHSAFNLQNIRQARIERADLAGLAEQEGVEDEEGPIPNYPRTMLKFEISDGSINLSAIEYRPLPELKLGETPLGYKLILKNVLIRNGILFLEPGGIELKGHLNEDRDSRRDQDFVRSLRRRMGKPDPPQQGQEGDPPQDPPPAIPIDQPAQVNAPAPRPPYVASAPQQGPDIMDFDEDEPTLVPRPTSPSSLPLTSNTAVESRFFSSGPGSSAQRNIQSSLHQLQHVMSPVRGTPIVLGDSSMESVGEDFFNQPPAPPPRSNSSGVGSSRVSAPESTIAKDEFDFDDDLDPAFLDEIDRVEKAALTQAMSASQPVGTTSKRSQPLSANPGPTSDSAPPRVGTSYPQPPTKAKRTLPISPRKPTRTQAQACPPRTVQPDIITIEDDDDDKENVRASPRPRRRRRGGVIDTDTVIDISD